MIRDHYRAFNVFDVKNKTQIAYATCVPYEFANIEPPYIDERCLSSINKMEEILKVEQPTRYKSPYYNQKRLFRELQTYFVDSNLQEVFGYRVLTKQLLPYDHADFSEIIGDEPEIIVKLKENPYTQPTIDCIYFSAGGTPRYIGLRVETNDAELPTLQEFSHLENFNRIRNASLLFRSVFPVKYWIDLQNPENISIMLVSPTPEALKMPEYVYENVRWDFYEDLKKDWYEFLQIENVITEEDLNYILKVSPGIQQSKLKYLWVNGKIENIELESVCVHEFEDV